MASSMTGFGRGSYSAPQYTVRVEIRSVNHRFLEVHFRLPRSLNHLEERLRRLLGSHLSRGKIDLSIHLNLGDAAGSRVGLDHGLVSGYRQALVELAEHLALPVEIRLDQFLHVPDLFVVEPVELDPDLIWEGVSQAVEQALTELEAMRRTEGDKLIADMLPRLAAMGESVSAIEDRAPLVVENYRQQLERRLTELLGQNNIDQGRLAQEAAIFADRCCINEELVRLRSHLGQLRETINGKGALGRRADFILQEINREVNTIGSKASDLTITQTVIDIKSELEKMREQVQNLE